MERVKYPRTPHLPWSEGATRDDVMLIDTKVFEGREVVVTEKMDGECTTLGRSYIHARSTESGPHPSRDWIKRIWGGISWRIPTYQRICGENLFAEHSIHYNALPDYFLGFTIFENDHGMDFVLSWNQTVYVLENIGLIPVPELYRGIWDEPAVRACMSGVSVYGGKQEGYVVRLVDAFEANDFSKSVAKYVRAGHVQTDEHWMIRRVVQNGLWRDSWFFKG